MSSQIHNHVYDDVNLDLDLSTAREGGRCAVSRRVAIGSLRQRCGGGLEEPGGEDVKRS